MMRVFLGDTIAGTINLKLGTPGSKKCGKPFAIPAGAIVTMYWPGTTASVLLSSTDPDEILITVPGAGTFDYKMSSTQSLLLRKGTNMSIDIVVVTLDNKTYTFEEANALEVKTRANP